MEFPTEEILEFFYNNLVILNQNYYKLGKGVSQTKRVQLDNHGILHQTMTTLLLTLDFVIMN